MKTTRRILIGALLALPLATHAFTVSAQQYPAKPITFIVPWPAGGTTDIIGRLLGEAMSKELGQPVAVVNRVGGGGAVGTKAAFDAPKDGYTVLVTTSGNHVLTPIKGNVGYQPDDFIGIGQISSRTLILATKSDRWKSARELIADAKANPGKFTFGAVPNVLPFLVASGFARAADIKLTHVPQTGGAPGVTGVLGGHLDLVPESLESVQQHLKSGAMRGLLVFNEARDPAAPDVPTAKELGFDVVGNPWTGLAVAKGTPEPIVARLRDVMAKVAKDPAFVATVERSGASVEYLDGPAFTALFSRDFEKFKAASQ
ncbi:MAG: tripartite tricarboxylate transporter substrate binding protein [Alphaproteobacteria bacterium]|nr:tripartite tricarboxylate transporter substrate binding protein [Alphaproteobacteria bacterium]